MELITFQGLNCYHNSIISIAHEMGLPYHDCFSTLWGETDFRYNPYRQIYLTKRLISNLLLSGVKVDILDDQLGDNKEQLLALIDDEFFIAGVDAFFLPWVQFYQTFHGAHYFFVRNERKEILHCFDPTYHLETTIPHTDLVSHLFALVRISDVGLMTADPFKDKYYASEIKAQAQEILAHHPHLQALLEEKICNCADEHSEDMILLAKYIDALIDNRYLYRSYLAHCPLPYTEYCRFFSDNFFAQWKAVKNGIYKIAIRMRDKQAVNVVRDRLSSLICLEMKIAETILEKI